MVVLVVLVVIEVVVVVAVTLVVIIKLITTKLHGLNNNLQDVLQLGRGTRSKMTGTPPSSFEHLSVVMTTETAGDVTQTTAANVAMTLSSSRGVKFYFQCAVPVMGVVGAAANAIILYALVASKQHKKRVTIFCPNPNPNPNPGDASVASKQQKTCYHISTPTSYF